jgi:N-methylhydantoinase A
VVCGTMVRAVKAFSTCRGRDPRSFDLYAFGGNGPVVAAAIAGIIGMERVIIPMRSGVFSSFGLLLSDVEQEISVGFLRPLSSLTAAGLDAAFAPLEAQLAARMKTEGYNPGDYEVSRACDLRYIGQAHELTVGMPAGGDAATMLSNLTAAFGKEHERTYGHHAASEPIEAVALRVSARAAVEKPERGAGWSQIKDRAPQATMRPAYFGADHGLLDTPVISRPDLIDSARNGPLIVEEYDATCVVPPGWAAGLDADGNIVLTKEG